MPLITRRIPHYTQPQGAARVDRSKPEGRAITHCFPLNGDTREIVTGAQLTLGAGGSIGTDPRGKSLRGNGAAACASIPLDLSAYNKLSISFWLYWDAYAADDDLALEFTPNANNENGFFVDPNYSGTAHLHTSIGQAGAPTNSVTFDRPIAAAWNHLVFNFDRTLGSSVSAHQFFINGIDKPVIAQQNAQALTGNFANSTLFLFSRNNASLFGAGRMQNLVIRGGYRMSAAEAKAEYDNPWQVFESGTQNIFTSDAAGGTVSNALSCTLESLLSLAVQSTGAVESLAALAQTSTGALESTQALAALSISAIESSQGLAGVSTGALESTQALAALSISAIESSQGLAGVSTGAVESLAALAQTSTGALESQAEVSAQPVVNVEALGAAAVSVLANVPIEALQGLAGVNTGALEALGAIGSSYLGALEALGALSAIAEVRIEALGAATAQQAVNVEALGAAAVSVLADVPIESNATITVYAAGQYESVQALSTAITFGYGALAALAKLLDVPVEALQGATVNIITNVVERTVTFTIEKHSGVAFTIEKQHTIKF